jgi:hypothetical protein
MRLKVIKISIDCIINKNGKMKKKKNKIGKKYLSTTKKMNGELLFVNIINSHVK